MYQDGTPHGLPADLLITALASRLADLQGARTDLDADAIAPPVTQKEAGRRAFVAGAMLSALEQHRATGDSGFVPIVRLFDLLKQDIDDLTIEELRFCARFLDVDREVLYESRAEGKIQKFDARNWSRLVRYQVRRDRVLLSDAGRIWMRVLRHREHWLFEDKEVEKIVSALNSGLFDQIPVISEQIVSSIRSIIEQLTQILESPTLRALEKQYEQQREHYSGVTTRCHEAAVQAVELVRTSDLAARHAAWIAFDSSRTLTLSQVHGLVLNVLRATESLQRNWAELLNVVQQGSRPRVGVIRFDLALAALAADPPSRDTLEPLLDGLGGWAEDPSFVSPLDVLGCLPEALEPENDDGVEFSVSATPPPPLRSWLATNKRLLLAALKKGPKSLFDFIDDPALPINSASDVSGLFGAYVLSEPFGKKVIVVVESTGRLRTVDRHGYRITASDVVMRLQSVRKA